MDHFRSFTGEHVLVTKDGADDATVAVITGQGEGKDIAYVTHVGESEPNIFLVRLRDASTEDQEQARGIISDIHKILHVGRPVP